MSLTPVIQNPAKSRLNLGILASFFAIYVIWGSTFLAIRVAVLLVPPWFCAGIRFSVAGVLLYSFMRLKGIPRPSLSEWKSLALIGLLMFTVTYGALFWAEQFVPSGITAVLESTIPLFTIALEVFVLRQQRFRWQVMIAVLVGFIGVAVMLLKRGNSTTPLLPSLIVLVASLSWCLGAVLTRATTGPRALTLPASKGITAGAEMMIGGGVLLLVSLLSGEMHPFPHIPLKATLALIYLIIAGSLIGFSAFVYLLGKMPASRVASHAYINPVVAIALGYFLAAEPITPRTLIGAGLVIGSVLITLLESTP